MALDFCSNKTVNLHHLLLVFLDDLIDPGPQLSYFLLYLLARLLLVDVLRSGFLVSTATLSKQVLLQEAVVACDAVNAEVEFAPATLHRRSSD